MNFLSFREMIDILFYNLYVWTQQLIWYWVVKTKQIKCENKYICDFRGEIPFNAISISDIRES